MVFRFHSWLGDERTVATLDGQYFPPPWDVEEQSDCFVVRDRSGQALAYIYYEQGPGRRSATGLLSKDEAQRIAANFAKFPISRRLFDTSKREARSRGGR
jgi:hypothetical protein